MSMTSVSSRLECRGDTLDFVAGQEQERLRRGMTVVRQRQSAGHRPVAPRLRRGMTVVRQRQALRRAMMRFGLDSSLAMCALFAAWVVGTLIVARGRPPSSLSAALKRFNDRGAR